MAYAEVVVSSSQATSQSLSISVLDLILSRPHEPASSAIARSVELLPPVDSMEPLWSDTEKAAVENRLGAAIVGSDATVHVGLEKLVNDTHADEVIVVTDTYEHSNRMDSYQCVARIAAEIKLVPNVARRFK